jgi:G3E family GTPase
VTPTRPEPRPLPITIITGFLGAGKTTLLNRILNGKHGLRVAVLVNDFGSVNIDSELVIGVEGETISLSNGCICCTIRDDLLDAVFRVILADNAPDYIVIETSGVSDPFAVAQTFLTPELRPYVRVDGILTVVDAEQIRDLRDEQEVLAMDQISAADIILLNKADLVTEAQLRDVNEWLRAVAEHARIYPTTQAEVPLELLLSVGDFDPERLAERAARDVHVHEADASADHDHDHDHDHTTVFSTWTYSVAEPLSFAALREAVQRMPTTIYRAKGFLNLQEYPDNQCVLHVVGRRASLQIGAAWGERPRTSRLVFIASHGGIDPAAMERALDACRAQRAAARSQTTLANALAWMRKMRESGEL